MNDKKFKVLLIVEQCNPDWPSVPLEGYNYYHSLSQIVNVTLVTHQRNRQAIEKIKENQNQEIVYISESSLVKKYYRLVSALTSKLDGSVNWPLYHALSYPIYAEFNHKVYKRFKDSILRGDYDIVHAITPMMPRYPVEVIKVCKKTPFVFGPVNGGVPFPPGFQETARKENANLNFIRNLGRFLIPGYRETYQKANKVLAGSTYTLNMLKDIFNIPDNRISLFYENGIPESFLNYTKNKDSSSKINLLFVGRLVPYKCADLVIEAVKRLEKPIQNKIQLIIVGDGPEKSNLEKKVKEANLDAVVNFTGWVNQKQTFAFYSKADIFCFPSIREFGGAVVLEAMASGLPCIVANNGGIGEYVTEETGFKIEPLSREYLTQELTNKIKILVQNEKLRKTMSAKSIERVQEFTWQQKAKKIVTIYKNLN